MNDEAVFVFGSNEAGIHGAGAAREAYNNHGAVRGQGFGPQGNSFATPTCALPTGQLNSKISYEKLTYYIKCFILYALQHPELDFQVTRIGCGFAGWKEEDVAPLFDDAPLNCYFDEEWKPYLGDKKRYWGTFPAKPVTIPDDSAVSIDGIDEDGILEECPYCHGHHTGGCHRAIPDIALKILNLQR